MVVTFNNLLTERWRGLLVWSKSISGTALQILKRFSVIESAQKLIRAKLPSFPWKMWKSRQLQERGTRLPLYQVLHIYNVHHVAKACSTEEAASCAAKAVKNTAMEHHHAQCETQFVSVVPDNIRQLFRRQKRGFLGCLRHVKSNFKCENRKSAPAPCSSLHFFDPVT